VRGIPAFGGQVSTPVYRQAGLTLRMTAVFYCHPEDFSPKDPSAFRTNQQSLALRGIPAFGGQASVPAYW